MKSSMVHLVKGYRYDLMVLFFIFWFLLKKKIILHSYFYTICLFTSVIYLFMVKICVVETQSGALYVIVDMKCY